MISNVIGILLIVIFTITTLLVLISIYTTIKEYRSNKYHTSISFKESMDLVELPVVTFYNNNQKLNFLLDTGSNISYINAHIIPLLKYTLCNKMMDTIGVEGIKIPTSFCNMSITYKNQEFEDEFSIIDLNSAFAVIKQESGVQIHGILGSKFFEKYKYVLDFSKLIAYSKK